MNLISSWLLFYSITEFLWSSLLFLALNYLTGIDPIVKLIVGCPETSNFWWLLDSDAKRRLLTSFSFWESEFKLIVIVLKYRFCDIDGIISRWLLISISILFSIGLSVRSRLRINGGFKKAKLIVDNYFLFVSGIYIQIHSPGFGTPPLSSWLLISLWRSIFAGCRKAAFADRPSLSFLLFGNLISSWLSFYPRT